MQAAHTHKYRTNTLTYTPTTLPTPTQALPKISSGLKGVVYWSAPGGLAEGAADAAKATGVEVYSWEEFQKLGAENPSDADPPTPEEYSTFMYTSGTTGDPKGVMLTHNALVYVFSSLSSLGAHVSLCYVCFCLFFLLFS